MGDSKLKQINIRVADDTETWMRELQPVIAEALGLHTVTQADLFRMGIIELRRKFMPDAVAKAVPKKSKK